MRISRFILFLIATLTSAKAQNVDSLKILLKNAKHVTIRCNVLNVMIETENNDTVWIKYNAILKSIDDKNLNISKTLSFFYKKQLASHLITKAIFIYNTAN